MSPIRPSLSLALSFGTVALLASGCGNDTEPPTGPALKPASAESGPALASAAAGPLSFSQVTVGALHTCGLATDGRTYCWGDGDSGQLGTGAFVNNRPRPSLVTGGIRFVQVSAGHGFTCGVTAENRAYCWGENAGGQLGDGSNTNRPAPVRVAGGRRFRQIRAGESHTCAVNTANAAFCWGVGGSGQLGDGKRTGSTVPVRVVGGHQWRRVAAGGAHSCGITSSRQAFCWGRNETAQLGDGTTTRRDRPVPVAGGLSFIHLIPGSNHTCGVTTDDRGWCWGENDNGELGTQTSSPFGFGKPAPVMGNRRFTQVIAGFVHTCGVTKSKRAYCWGFNGQGQNGNGSTSTGGAIPTLVAGGHEFVGVSTGVQTPPPLVDAIAEHSCGITTTNRIYCWGKNNEGQLGDGTTTRRLTPAAVVGP